jgi:hypothetical protein
MVAMRAFLLAACWVDYWVYVLALVKADLTVLAWVCWSVLTWVLVKACWMVLKWVMAWVCWLVYLLAAEWVRP